MQIPLPLIACSLEPNGQAARLVEWEQLLLLANSREEVPGGVRYVFSALDGIEARVRALAEAEQECCSFLRFAVNPTAAGIEMAVRAPVEGQEALRFLFAARV